MNKNQHNTLFSVGVYKEALAFALRAHGEQKTPHGLPYSFHIVSVAAEVICSLSAHPISYDNANVALSCALLHDVLEDTDTQITTDLEIPQIDTVIAGVKALTKDKTLPSKKEQMLDSLERLRQQPACVQMVKLADRITNLGPAPKHWDAQKRTAYRDEAQLILNTLKGCNPYLEARLQAKIDGYEIVS